MFFRKSTQTKILSVLKATLIAECIFLVISPMFFAFAEKININMTMMDAFVLSATIGLIVFTFSLEPTTSRLQTYNN